MSRSVSIQKPEWTPEEKEYLGFFGTLAKSLAMAEASVPCERFELRRRGSGVPPGMPEPLSLPAPVCQPAMSRAQAETARHVEAAAGRERYEPKMIEGPPGMITIEMMKVPDSREPVYVRR
jgi:hypothetical protein